MCSSSSLKQDIEMFEGQSLEKGKVSVIMPCYNDGKFIQEAIDSVLHQTYQNFEIIVIDDGSDDIETVRVLNEIKYPQIKVIHTENQGVSMARNTGFAIATGEYFLCLDADDKIGTTYLEKAVDVLDKNEKVGIVYSQAVLFGCVKGKWNLPTYSIGQIVKDNCIFVSAVCRTSLLDKIPSHGFNPNMVYMYEDWDFFLSFIEQNVEVCQLDEVLFYYRQSNNRRNKRFEYQREAVRQLMINHFGWFLENKKYLHSKQKEIFYSRKVRKIEKTKEQSRQYQKSYIKYVIQRFFCDLLTIIKIYILFPVYTYKLCLKQGLVSKKIKDIREEFYD